MPAEKLNLEPQVGPGIELEQVGSGLGLDLLPEGVAARVTILDAVDRDEARTKLGKLSITAIGEKGTSRFF